MLTIPAINEGEIYVGSYGDAKGNLIHFVLLPGDNDDATWQEQIDWAKRIGGDLPNRIEQAMLWANFRDQFQKRAYWSNESHHDDANYAFYQTFCYGIQTSNRKGSRLSARAVRRIVA